MCKQQWGQPTGTVLSNHENTRRKRSYLLNELQKLTLCGPRIAQEQDVDVPPQPHAIRQNLLRSAKEETGNGFFNIWKEVSPR